MKSLRLPHNLDLINGIRVVRDTFDSYNELLKDAELIIYDPVWTYGEDKINDPTRQDKIEEPRFVPNYVLFAQKCLKFTAFFRHDIDNFLNRKSNIRNVYIYYFLEDDTMSITEPMICNAGYKQGKLVRRAKIPKNEFKFYHWKDLNIGLTLNIYGIEYHLIDCDSFTRHFLTSQGIDVNEKQELPKDAKQHEHKLLNEYLTPKHVQHRFINQEEVLTFIATWNNDKYSILYHLIDSTILVRRIPQSKEDNDPMSKILLRRTKIMKEKQKEVNSYVEEIGSNQPSIDEMKNKVSNEVEYYGPADFKVGETITILGRTFHLIDCSHSTRKFYLDKLEINQPLPEKNIYDTKTPTRLTFKKRIFNIDEPITKRAYDGMTKRDVYIKLLNLSTKFRYSLKMDVIHPEDDGRQFIMEYNLSDGTMAINEIETQNSGRRGGIFLGPTVVAKTDSSEDEPNYYTEQDFYIGAKINVFSHYFIITGADFAVWSYIKKHPNDFNDFLRNNMREYFEANENKTKKNPNTPELSQELSGRQG